MKPVYLPSGKVAYFPNEWSDDQVFAALAKADQRKLVAPRSDFRGGLDSTVNFLGTAADLFPGLIDMAVPDPVPESARGLTGAPLSRLRPLIGEAPTDAVQTLVDMTPVGGGERAFLRGREVIGGGLKALGGLADTAKQALSAGRTVAGAIGQPTAASVLGAGAGAAGALSGPLSGAGRIVVGDLERQRAEENRRRVDENRPTLEEEGADMWSSRLARGLEGGIDDAKRGLLSDYQLAADRELGRASEAGVGNLLGYLADSPLDAASSVLPSAAAWLIPSMIAGRAAKVGGLGDKAATAVAVQGTSALAAEAGARDFAESVMSAPLEQMQKVPEYTALIGAGQSDQQARLTLAQAAYDTAMGAGAVIGAGTGAVAQRLGLAPVEEILTRGARLNSSRIASAVGAGLKEMPGEGLQGAGEAVAGNLGRIEAGMLDERDALKGVGSAAVLEAAAGGVMGGAIGFAAPARVADAVTAKPTETDPVAQAQRDVAAIYAAADTTPPPIPDDLAQATAPPPVPPVPPAPPAPPARSAVIDNGDGTVSFGATTLSGPDAMAIARRLEQQERARAAPAPAAPAVPSAPAPAAPAASLEGLSQASINVEEAIRAAGIEAPAVTPSPVQAPAAVPPVPPAPPVAAAVPSAAALPLREQSTQPPVSPTAAMVERPQDDDAGTRGAAIPAESEPVTRNDILRLRGEIGWSQRGGNIIRGGPISDDIESGASFGRASGDVTGRTKWEPMMRVDGAGESTFWRNRPMKITQREAEAALDRFAAGEVLTRKQQQFIDYATQTAREYNRERIEADAEFARETALRPQSEAPVAEALDDSDSDSDFDFDFDGPGRTYPDDQIPFQRREVQRESGIPAGLPSVATAESEALTDGINRYRASRGDTGPDSKFETIAPYSLPDAIRRALDALARATGTRVVVVRNLTPEAFSFNGVNFRNGILYVDEGADMPAVLVAAHEWVHQLKADQPLLYRRLEAEVRRQGRLDAYGDRLRAETRGDVDADMVAEELTADAVADAMTDPAFLRRVVSEGGTMRRVAESFLAYLDGLLAKIGGRGTNAYFQDVQAFRDELAAVLREYRNTEKRPGEPSSAADAESSFQRRGAASADLFAAPTQADAVRAEQQRRDAQRDGRTGTGRTDMMAGDGELFAGSRPEQKDIETGELPAQDVSTYGEARPLPAVRERGATEPAGDAATGRRGRAQLRGQLDLFVATRGNAAPDAVGEPAVRVDRPKLASAVGLAQIGQFRSGVDRVRSMADAAHILAPLRKSPQEKLMVLALDADGRPLTVLQHTVGLIDQVPIDPATIFGAMASVPGIRSVVFAHNHPSGNPEVSAADRQFDMVLSRLFEDSGIDVRGSIIVQPGRRTFTAYGNATGPAGIVTKDTNITTARRRGTVDVTERRLRRVAPVGRGKLSNPEDAKAMVRAALADTPAGVIMLDNQHGIIGTVPFDPKTTAKLRTNDVGTSHARYIADAVGANAAAVIVYGPKSYDGAVNNLGAAYARSGIRLLDVMLVGDGSTIDSLAESGRLPTSNSPMFQRRLTGDVFESALLRSVEDGKGAPRRATAESWKGWLDGAVRRGEFKQSERDWLGVDAWLERQGAAVPREALADYVRANQVQLEETQLTPLSDDQVEQNRASYTEAERVLTDAGYEMDEGMDGEPEMISPDGDPITSEDQLPARLRPAYRRITDGVPQEVVTGRAKFDQYQIPGGTNYREVLLTLPPAPNTGRFTIDLGPLGIASNRQFATRAEAQDFINGLVMAGNDLARTATVTDLGSKDNFRSPHWDQVNVLAHVRMNERTDSQGREVLFIEEIQSDWHQEGRKKGYGGNSAAAKQAEESARTAALAAIRRNDMLGFDFPGQALGALRAPDWRSRWEVESDADAAAIDAWREADAAASSAMEAVPEAPLRATEEWAMLAFKRVVREAVERGKSVIAWTTGDQQAERYKLSNTVKSIVVYKSEVGREVTMAMLNGGIIVAEVDAAGKISEVRADARFDSLQGKPLVDVVGKEMAEKIMEAGHGDRFSGDGLDVGKRGMAGFYDRILPSAVNKWAKKFGGRVSDVEVATETKAFDDDGLPQKPLPARVKVHALEITPSMREAASGPMPMFQRRTPTNTPAFRQWFRDSRVVNPDGSPMPVYHGTGEQFAAFDPSLLTTATGHASSGLGFFFTPDRATAEAYADKASDYVPAQAVVLETYLSVQNPYVMTLDEARAFDGAAEASAARKELERRGFDGVHIPEQNVWVAFNANQVKRTDNLGTWNPSDDRMMFSRRNADEGGADARPEPAPQSPPDTIEATIQRTLAALGMQPDAVTVLDSPKDLPPGVKRSGLDGRTEGIYDIRTGRVFLFRSGLRSPSRAVWVALHELVGHKGLRALLPAADFAKMLDAAGTNDVLRGIARAMQAEAVREAEQGVEGARPVGDPSLFLEEALAEMTASFFTGDTQALISRYGAGIEAEMADRAAREKSERSAQSLVKRLIALAKRRLFNTGAPMSDAEVVGLIGNAYKALRSSEATPPTSGSVDRGATPPTTQSRAVALQSRPVDPQQESLVARKVGSVLRNELRQFEKQYQALFRPDRPESPESIPAKMNSVRAALAETITSRFKMLEAKYPKSVGLRSLRGMVATSPGRDVDSPETLIERVQRLYSLRSNQHAKIIEKYNLEDLTKEQNAELRASIHDPNRQSTPRLRLAANDIAKLFAEVAEDARSAGLEFGEVKDIGYLTRIYDEAKIGSDKDKFLRDAEALYSGPEFDRAVGKSVRNIVYEKERLTEFMIAAKAAASESEDVRLALSNIKDHLRTHRSTSDLEFVRKVEAEIDSVRSIVAESYGKRRAQAWLYGILTPSMHDNFAVAQSPGAPMLKERELSAAADTMMADWMVTDVGTIVDTYLRSMARKTAFAQTFGPAGEKVEVATRKMIDEGVEPHHVALARRMASYVAGQMQTPLPTEIQSGMDWFHAVGYVALLDKATISSLAEAVTLVIRTRDPKMIFAPIVQAYRAMTKSEKAIAVQELSELVGVVTSRGAESVLINQLGGDHAMTPKPAALLDNFFRVTLLKQLTSAQRTFAAGVAHDHLVNLARRIRDGRDVANNEALLRELGVRDIGAFTDFLLTYPGYPSASLLFDAAGRPTPMGDAYVVAVRRFVDQTIQNPNASLRPELAGNSLGRFMYGIMSFSYSFYENIIKREVSVLGRRMKRDGKGAAAKEFALYTIPSFAALAVAQTIISTLRELIFNLDRYEDEEDEEIYKKLGILGLSRSFGIGSADPIIQYLTGIRYGRSAAETAIGAVPGFFLGAVDDITNLGSEKNAETTTTAEYRTGRAIYSALVQPAFNSALSMVPGKTLSSIFATAGITVGGDMGREPFARMFGLSPERVTSIDRAYTEERKRFKEVMAEIEGRIVSTPPQNWQSELEALKSEYPGLLDTVDLELYADNPQNRRLGRAGMPKPARDGRLPLRAREGGVDVLGELAGRTVFRMVDGKAKRFREDGLEDLIADAGRAADTLRENRRIAVVELEEIAKSQVSASAALEKALERVEGDRSKPLTRSEIMMALRAIESDRRGLKREAVRLMRGASEE